MTTPVLGLPEISEGVANQVTQHNVALRHIEAKTVRALSMITMAPPAAVEGDSYVIPAGASGAWSGKAGQIAAFIGGAWSYLAPIEGIRLWINDLDAEYVFDGAAWVANGGGGGAEDAIAAHEAATNPHPQYLTEIPAQPFDVHCFYPGVPAASAILLDVEFARAVAFPANFAGSAFKARIGATGPVSIDVQKNGVSVGSIAFGAGDTSATATSAALSFAAGDLLSLVGPAIPDATLENLRGVLAGTR